MISQAFLALEAMTDKGDIGKFLDFSEKKIADKLTQPEDTSWKFRYILHTLAGKPGQYFSDDSKIKETINELSQTKNNKHVFDHTASGGHGSGGSKSVSYDKSKLVAQVKAYLPFLERNKKIITQQWVNEVQKSVSERIQQFANGFNGIDKLFSDIANLKV